MGVAGGEAVNEMTSPMSSSELAELYGRQRHAMISLARLLTGSVGIAEEIVQEAFLKMRQLERQPENPDAYLRTVVANLSKSHLRRLRLERRPTPQERIILDEPAVDETWAAVCRLPFRLRAVLVLRFYQDLSESEISRVLGCKPGTVKSRLHRGLDKLREELI
jgi:RNA polymerase sigma factor (sigma-70 family)